MNPNRHCHHILQAMRGGGWGESNYSVMSHHLKAAFLSSFLDVAAFLLGLLFILLARKVCGIHRCDFILCCYVLSSEGVEERRRHHFVSVCVLSFLSNVPGTCVSDSLAGRGVGTWAAVFKVHETLPLRSLICFCLFFLCLFSFEGGEQFSPEALSSIVNEETNQ